MAETIRVYVNSKGIDVPPASTALQAVEAWDAAQADAVRRGERMITDSRGLPASVDATVYNGAVFRVVRARQETTGNSEMSETL